MDKLVEIQQSILDANSQLAELAVSLQKEFEFYLTWPNNDKTVTAKKKQMLHTEALIKKNNQLFDLITQLFEQNDERQFQVEACVFYHGISLIEYRRFVQSPVNEVVDLLKRAESEKWFEVPTRFMPYVNMDIEPAENIIKYAQAPTIPFEQLKQAVLK